MIEEAAAAAKAADVVIVFVGTDDSVEQEGRDRRRLGLPGNQQKLVEAVFTANPKTIAVEASAGPLTVPWMKENLPAIVQTWWSGEEGGNAIADVLFGNYNPAGRLPHTVYASEEQVPPVDEYDISKGFTYMYIKGKPLFAFGHGLSYSTFRYGEPTISPTKIDADAEATVSVEIENTSGREGDEVAQLYVHQRKSDIPMPALELRGFDRISLKPGEKKTVTFKLPAEKLAHWDEKAHRFAVDVGEFDILLGASSGDIRSRGKLEIIAK
jgi:beta-glucosidase